MPPTKKHQYFSLQAGRGIASLMVVLYHAAIFVGGDSRYWHRDWIVVPFKGFALGVEYFFVLSGAVILLAHFNDIGHPSAVPSYLWKRFRRVYPIYWLVLTVVILAYVLRPGLGAWYQTKPNVIVSGYLLVYLRPFFRTNLPVSWTLFHEVLFYAVFALLLANRKVGSAVLGVWWVLSFLRLFFDWAPYLKEYLFFPLHLLFAFGMLAAWLLRNGKVRFGGALVTTGLSAFAASMVWASLVSKVSLSYDFLAGAGATAIVLGAAVLEDQKRIHIAKPLRFLGDASYSIYLIHYPFFMFFAPLLYKLWLHAQVPFVIPFAIMPLSALAVGCAMHVYVELPLINRLSGIGKAALSAA